MCLQDGSVDDVRHASLSSLSNVVAELVGLALFVWNFMIDEPLDLCCLALYSW
jgi:hypothetical protein